MPPHDYKISKGEDSKRRPSIELSPTLEKPVYIITKNMNGSHILYLIEMLEKEKIQYQLQQETSTLGFALNQKFFVIVDNKYGEVVLGNDFSSLLMTIVGYPKVGSNKKNKYYEHPSDIIKCYKEFRNAPDVKLSKFGEKDAVITSEKSQVKSKIEVRSIIKYKSQDAKEEPASVHSQKETSKKQGHKLKLIILENKADAEYTSICESLLSNERTKAVSELARNLDEIRKKTLFHTNSIKIYYLVNQKDSQQLIKSIFIGEVVIYCKQQQTKLKHMVDQPKIYAVAYQKDQLFKILRKVGFEPSTQPFDSSPSQVQPSKLNDSSNSPFLLKNQSNVKYKGEEASSKIVVVQRTALKRKTISKDTVVQKEVVAKQTNNTLNIDPNVPQIVQIESHSSKVVEIGFKERTSKQIDISKIDNNISIDHSNANDVSDNVSVISKASSGSRKIKRINPKKKNKQNIQAKESSQINENKEKRIEQDRVAAERKKTLKTSEYYQVQSKSKKNLTFKQNLVENTRLIKRVKSVTKYEPQVFQLQCQNHSTMTQNQYYAVAVPANTLNASNTNSFFNRSLNSTIEKSTKTRINALFYRQFVPKFHNLAQVIKLKPSSIFPNNEKNAYVQPFVYMKQYDRYVRRLKNHLRQKKQSNEEYNFVVLLREEDLLSFVQYCRAKNRHYEEEDGQGSTIDNNYSCLSRITTKMNAYVFVEGEVAEELISCGRIDIYKHQLLSDASDFDLSRTLAHLQRKVRERNREISS